jgi:hypothetical protein
MQMISISPPGVLESSILSTQYSLYKKKREKLQGNEPYQTPEESPYGIIRADTFAKTTRLRKKDEPETPAPNDDKKRKSIECNDMQTDKKTKV